MEQDVTFRNPTRAWVLFNCKFCIQGSANPQTPGSKNKRIKICVLLPAAGRRMQLFTSFSQNLD